MNRAMCIASLVLAAATTLAACGGEDLATADGLPTAVPIEHHEGAVCGMIVRDQSAPRAQVLHRDGTRSFLCSIGDLLAYLQAPSPHGEALAIMVEVMDPDEDPMETHTGPHPWVPAGEATYVLGVRRKGIMGEPVLVYRDRAAAEAAVGAAAAVIVGFDGLERWWNDLHDEATGDANPVGGSG